MRLAYVCNICSICSGGCMGLASDIFHSISIIFKLKEDCDDEGDNDEDDENDDHNYTRA